MPHFQARHYKLRQYSPLAICMTFLSAKVAPESEAKVSEGGVRTVPAPEPAGVDRVESDSSKAS
jgi:hypothetical protein